jgi:hypothetical protein
MVVWNECIKRSFEVNNKIVFSSHAGEKKGALHGAFGRRRSL